MILTPASLLPAQESERLQALRGYDIIASAQEKVFDELVELTAQLFGVPIAYVGLVEAHEMHYKATRGFAIPVPQPRAELLCSLVVKEGQVVVYHDLAAVIATPVNALAIQTCLVHQVRFYAGAPLRVSGPHVIGTLCLVGPQSRGFSTNEQSALETIADLAGQLIAVRHHYYSAPALGEARWQAAQTRLGEEIFALGALLRYLLTRYGATVPVAAEILQPVVRRLGEVLATLGEEDE